METGNITLSEKFRELAKQFPDEVVMQIKAAHGYKKYTYQDLYQMAQAVAERLQKLEIKKGDRVALVLENRPEWGAIYFGIMFVGAIAVPLDPQSTKEDINYFIENSAAKVIFTQQQFLGLFPKEVKPKIITIEEKIFAVKSTQEIAIKVKPDDIASILYTSGTTGVPKGVMLSHKNFYANFISINKLNILGKGHNILAILPLHHSFPFMVTLIIPLFSRSTITYVTSLKSEEILVTMRETGVTVLAGVPQLFYMFYKHISSELNKIPFLLRVPLSASVKLSYLLRKISNINLNKLLLAKIHKNFGKKLKFFVSGGAKLDEEVAEFLMQIGFTILEGYGLTETAPVVTFNPLKKQKIGSVGKPIPNVKVKIINPDEGGIGEVAISGPNVMQGYYKLKSETEEVLKNNWFYSGDLGYLDKDGYLFLTGRKKELIILSSGKNIAPEEIEAHYINSLYIKELCVLAAGKEAEKLMAVIVPDLEYFRKTGEVNVYSMIKWDLENFSKKSPAYKRIMGFIIAKEDLPRTRLGKLKRFIIKEQYKDQLLGIKKAEIVEPSLSHEDLQLLASPIGKAIINLLTTETGREIKLDDHLEMDLGIDSLARVELTVSLEKTLKIHIPETLMAKVFNVRELITSIIKLEKTGKKLVSKAFSWQEILATDPSKELRAKIIFKPSLLQKFSVGLTTIIAKILFKIFWRVKIFGIENLATNKKFILCSNHNSYLDGLLIASVVPRTLRKKLFFLGTRGIFASSIMRNISKLINVIPIDPGAHLVDAMQASAYVLRHNKIMCIFPEGARSIDGEIKIFKKGIGILAKEINIDLLPVYIKGSYEAWPRTQRFPKSYPIQIIFGQPCDPTELQKIGRKLGAKDDYEAIVLGIREKINDIIPV
jgi:long-chain acyl-CoA synthetase